MLSRPSEVSGEKRGLKKKMTVADLILKYIEAEGVEYIFGIPGTTLVPLLSACNRNPRIKPILAKHEEGAAFMADGYARVKGSLGVCFATSGSGATNLVSGVATAFLDDVPPLVPFVEGMKNYTLSLDMM